MIEGVGVDVTCGVCVGVGVGSSANGVAVKSIVGAGVSVGVTD